MKKFLLISSIVLTTCLLFALRTYASEEYISPDKVPNSTYIIGNYMFTKETILTTKHIMLASKTIDSTNLNDMVVYYKNARGKWIDGLSGEEINPKETFDIKYTDVDVFEGEEPYYTSNVDLETNTLDNSTYIIGKYMFTKDTLLTTRHIMLAARSIAGNSLDDMKISYKNARGKWVDGLSGKEVEVDESTIINYKDLTPMYTITYNTNGGSELNKTFVVLNGRTYGELETATKEYAKFDGWYTSISDGDKIEATTTVNLHGNQTLYAHWTMDQYKVTYKVNGSDETEEHDYFTKTIIKENDIKKKDLYLSLVTFNYNYPDAPSNKSLNVYKKYTSNGWSKIENSTTCEYSKDDVVEFNEDVTLYPCYKTETVAVEFNDVTRTGYDFQGWYTDSYGGKKIEDKYYAGTSNKTFYAHWKAKEYTITFDGQGGILETNTKKVTYDSVYGDLPTPIKEGYRFIGWYTTPIEGIKVDYRTFVDLESDQVLYARYERE